jgi:adenine-specific DNA-methyltransferase
MAPKKNKLELTWIGKENRPRLEPRILIEEPEFSHHAEVRREGNIFDNMLIHGDNLLALKALETDPAVRGKVKCIYIDPPYNTGNAFEHYDDGLEHSVWLNLIRERIEVLWNLLCEDGTLAVQIDDNEFARLYLMMAEICIERNMKVICVKMSEPSGLKMGSVKRLGTIPKLKEYVIICKKNGPQGYFVEKIRKGSWDREYNIFITGLTVSDRQRISELSAQEQHTAADLDELDKIGARIELESVSSIIAKEGISDDARNDWLFENSWRICQCATSASVLRLAKEKRENNSSDVFFVKSPKGIIYMVRAGFSDASAKPRVQLIFADDNLEVHPGDLWTDFRTTGLDGEGGVDFKNGKKPEALIKRIIGMCSKPGDLVLDSFAGSGTTGAVAHKMGRRWIMVELGEHAKTHIVPRMKNVIEGTDTGGVTGATGWKGGGGYRFYRLAPSLLQKDVWGNWVISKDYNAEMLAEAMCKHFNYVYAPSDEAYWMHGHASESAFIYVTTASLTFDQLRAISDEVGEDRSLLICCMAYEAQGESLDNLTLKKIPRVVLDRCEWGKDDYSLRIDALPMAEEVEALEEHSEPKTTTRKVRSADEPDLFGEGK